MLHVYFFKQDLDVIRKNKLIGKNYVHSMYSLLGADMLENAKNCGRPHSGATVVETFETR